MVGFVDSASAGVPEQVAIRTDRFINAFAATGAAPEGSIIYATVVVEETGLDELQITEHPVERSAAVTDHAFRRPSQLSMTAGWSAGDAAAAGDQNYLSGLYKRLLALQEDTDHLPVLCAVQTGKRAYTNMLLQSLQCRTDRRTENVLMVRMTWREVILVDTTATTVPADMNLQAMPEDTAGVADQGPRQPRLSPLDIVRE